MTAFVRRSWRLPWMVSLLFGGLFTVIVLFPLMAQARRDKTMAGWSRWLMRATGIRIRAHGRREGEPFEQLPLSGLVVANHVSWVDIFVINAVAPSSFIAKDDIAHWPLAGTLVARVGTLFLERGKRHAVHKALQLVAEHLKAGRRIAVFPEGTTGSGDALQPFYANLIEAAVQAESRLLPIALSYRGLQGEVLSGEGGVMDFVGQRIGFLGSVWRITGAPGVIADLSALDPIELPDGKPVRARHLMATSARQAISDRLGVPLDDSTPDTVLALRGGVAR